MIRSASALALLLLAAGCANSGRFVENSEYGTNNQRELILRQTGGNPSDAGFVLFGTDRNRDAREALAASGGTGVAVNAYLWRATLETLSFMPLASADPAGGVIITDWYSPPASQEERFKVTAYVLTRQLRSDGVRVQVFRQTLRNGQWVDSPAASSTGGEMEDRVLARARELRSQTAAAGR
jgi:hypothetical protein